jgi:hypothetical protein
MHYRTWTTIISSATIGLTGLTAPTRLHAQNRFTAESSPFTVSAVSLLTALSNYRAVRWASAADVIHCSPAPLTERPGVQTEFARPGVVPLEEAFADAQSVKRAIEYRAGSVAVEKW